MSVNGVISIVLGIIFGLGFFFFSTNSLMFLVSALLCIVALSLGGNAFQKKKDMLGLVGALITITLMVLKLVVIIM